MELRVGGQTLELLPGRAAFWRERSTLLVADCHFGKSAALRHHGLAVPEGSTEDDLRRLTTLLAQTGATRLIVVGDLFHAPAGYREEVLAPLTGWRARHRDLDFVLVPGNHDRSLHRLPVDWGLRLESGPMIDGPFAFIHAPDEADAMAPVIAGLVCFCGHLHPAVRLGDPRVRGISAPCFWLQQGSRLVLPSYGGFTGSAAVAPTRGDRIFAVTGDRVREIPAALLGLS